MTVVAQGLVTDRPLGRTLALIALRRFTGAFRLGNAAALWRDGLVVGGAGTLAADGAIKTALGAGLVTSSQAAELARAIGPGVDDVAVVIERAKLTPEQGAKLRRRVVANRAMRLFGVDATSFEIDDELPSVPEIVPIDARVIIFHGVRAHYSEERTLAELDSIGIDYKMRVGAGDLDAYGFGDDGHSVIDTLGKRPYRPRDLVAALPGVEGRTTLSILYALAVWGDTDAAGGRAMRPSTGIVPRPAGPRTLTPSASQLTSAAAAAIATGTTPPPRRRKSPSSSPDGDATRALVGTGMAHLEARADYFTLLGVNRDTSVEEIRKVYFELARKLHPDRITATGLEDIRLDAQRLFAQINAGFAILSHPTRRFDYIKQLDAGGSEAIARAQDDAEALARRVLDAEAHFRAGEMALRRNQLSTALIEFERAVELSPDESEHVAMLAWTRFCTATDRAAAARQARGDLDRAQRLAPRSATPNVFLGKIARAMGEDEKAIEHFREAVSLSPGHTEAMSELRILESRQGKPDDKKGLFSRLKR